MLHFYLIFGVVMVDTTSINRLMNENTNSENTSTEMCFLCGSHGRSVPEEIRLRNITHLYTGEKAMLNSVVI